MTRYVSLLALLFAGPAFAQQNATIPDPDPEIERQSFILPEGFEVNLYAADPLLAKPIQMNFDPQGRLWVACSETYPQIEPGKPANDKVLILEDTTGDGKADKTTVFADGLLIPTGAVPGDGGVYVADSTDLVHFSDPDSTTGKATRKRIVLSGFGTEDTHHLLHTLRWGPDGCLYMSQSIYIHSHVETPHGVRRLNAGGIWRFRPSTQELDVFCRGFINTWGTAWDQWGATFATDGAHFFGITPVVPGAYYPTAEGSSRILEGLNPGSPKYCGLEVLSGRHLPDDYQGTFVTNDFRGHRVCRFAVTPDGSAFASRELPELIKTTHPAFRPIDVKMGPDGAIYVADWYNPIIQHGEVDFRDPRRDKTHGRIWRITAKNRPLVEKPKLVGATVEELLEQLKSPEQWTRDQARRVLTERGKDAVLPQLKHWWQRLPGDDEDPNRRHNLLEALWVYQSIDEPNEMIVKFLLGGAEKHYQSAAAACRIAGDWADVDPQLYKILGHVVRLPNPHVRLEAVRALAKFGTAEAAVQAANVLDKPGITEWGNPPRNDGPNHPLDKWLDYALWLTLRDLAPQWLPKLTAGELDFGGDPKKIVFALKAAGTADVAKPLVTLWKSGKIGRDRANDVLPLIASTGGPDELAVAWAEARDPATSMDTRSAVLAALETSARQRNVRPTADRGAVVMVIGTEAGAKLAGAWKEPAARAPLVAVASAAATTPDLRRAAIDSLAELGSPESKADLLTLASAESPAAIRVLAVTALASIDIATAAGQAADLLTATPPPADPADLFAAFTSRKGGPAALTKALGDRKLSADTAKIGVRVAKAAAQPSDPLIAALTAAGGLGQSKTYTPDEVKQLLTDVAVTGDPARGERVFRRADLACMKCHAIAGAGGVVGPEMTSIGASAQPDYLLDSILDPNKAVKEGYHSMIVSTLDGVVLTGIKVRETNDELVLRDAEGKETVVPKADVDGTRPGRSLMPDGTHDPLTRAELVDLVRFLSMLGKVGGGFQATPGGVVRKWEAVAPSRELSTLLNRQRLAALTGDHKDIDWTPAYSLVSGSLPVAELPTFRPTRTAPLMATVRFRYSQTTAGPVKLVFDSPVGLTLWADTRQVDVTPETVLDLPAGTHTVTLAIDVGQRPGGLRVEVQDVPGSPAKAQVVAGK